MYIFNHIIKIRFTCEMLTWDDQIVVHYVNYQGVLEQSVSRLRIG